MFMYIDYVSDTDYGKDGCVEKGEVSCCRVSLFSFFRPDLQGARDAGVVGCFKGVGIGAPRNAGALDVHPSCLEANQILSILVKRKTYIYKINIYIYLLLLEVELKAKSRGLLVGLFFSITGLCTGVFQAVRGLAATPRAICMARARGMRSCTRK